MRSYSFLNRRTRDALLIRATGKQADQNIREYLAERTLLLAAKLCVIALAASLSRAFYGPWQPVYTVHTVLVALIWTVTIFRRVMRLWAVGAVFPLGVMGYAFGETYLYGLATGGPVFAMFVPLLCIPVFGFRNSMFVFCGVVAVMSVLALRVILNPAIPDPATVEHIASPLTWFVAAVAALILCFVNLSNFGTLMAALRERQRSFEEQARRIARDQERFELAMEGTNDGLWDWDLTTGQVYRSERWFNHIGYSRGEFPDDLETFRRLIHPQDSVAIPTTDPALLDGAGNKIESEFRLRHRDGSWVPILSRAFVVHKDGKPVRVVGTHIDLSERERLTADLRRFESMLYEGIEALPLGLAFFDRAGKLSMWNSKYSELMELDTGVVRSGGAFETMLAAHADVARGQFGYDRDADFVQARLRSLGDRSNPWEYQLDSGRTIELFECPTGRGGFLSVVTDVTEARRRQAELHQAQKMDAVGKLTGGIAHDFNNLLAVVQGNADVLSFSAPEMEEEISAIKQATRRGAELTQRLLAFSRQQPLRPTPVSPQHLIKGLLPILQRSLGEAYSIQCAVAADTWNILVDPGQLENALLNLAINGRDAMSRGGSIEISADNVTIEEGVRDDEIPPGDYVVIAVRDYGTGMSEDTRARAFDPFFTTKGLGQGSGLGLAMVYGFARQSGGGVTLDSVLGEGTTVRMYIRRAALQAPIEAHVPKLTAPLVGGGESILIIEDDSSVRDMTERMLQTLGYHITTAEDAVTAEQILTSEATFDLVLSDIVLPGGKFGPEVIRDVRKTREDFKVIFMSGYSPDVSEDFRSLVESSRLLNKPFSLQDLAEAIRSTLEEAPPAAAVGQEAEGKRSYRSSGSETAALPPAP